jgi:hypothetical protein
MSPASLNYEGDVGTADVNQYLIEGDLLASIPGSPDDQGCIQESGCSAPASQPRPVQADREQDGLGHLLRYHRPSPHPRHNPAALGQALASCPPKGP